MTDLKALAEKHVSDIQIQIDQLHEEIKERNKKQFEKIAALEAQKTPIEQLLKEYKKLEKADKPEKPSK